MKMEISVANINEAVTKYLKHYIPYEFVARSFEVT